MRFSRKHIISCLTTIAVAVTVSLTVSCGNNRAEKPAEEDFSLPDTLRVATLYSPSSYFIYREQPMGYDYSLVSQFVEDKGLSLQLEVAPSLYRAIEMLDSGLVDLIAYEIPEIAEYKDRVVPCGPRSETHQVLVQPKVKGKIEITDVTDLPGHDVYVEDKSRYLYRLQNLDQELGGGIGIHIVETDTLIADDLIEMVAANKIPLTVVDNDVAMINATYYPTLDISLALSFPQTSGWAVAPERKWLGDSIDAWLDTDRLRQSTSNLHKRYFELSKVNGAGPQKQFREGLAKYSPIIKKYAPELGWDWRMLAALVYQESKFNPDAQSWAGARGLLQVMPRTARNYGFDPDSLDNPDVSMQVAVKVLADLDRTLRRRVPDDRERLKFTLAAYNCGIGHISDAVALAEKQGLNTSLWEGNVEKALQQKSNPEYYNDPVVKNGYLRGRETIAYVKTVMELYDRFRRELPA